MNSKKFNGRSLLYRYSAVASVKATGNGRLNCQRKEHEFVSFREMKRCAVASILGMIRLALLDTTHVTSLRLGIENLR
ncbi:MAG: hypothetical protein H6652_05935 [Ardenticatenaceae bacterium]|nr:hypothetical protein [Ardenticatenaceae bacterium]